jgi:GT2 family glycosyltransferase
MNRRVSVIVPFYNRLDLLPATLDSILRQTQPVLEVLLIDDGSTKHTPDMVERCIYSRPEWRDRVRYHFQENQGQSVAMNVGIAMAKGDWLAFNGDDDVWLPWKLEWQFRALDLYGDRCQLCFTDGLFVNNFRQKSTLFEQAGHRQNDPFGVIEDLVSFVVKRTPVVWMQTVVARADVVREVGGLDPKLRCYEDLDFTFRMALATGFCFVNMPMVLLDRSPARHTGASSDWDREEFCLAMDQYRLEVQERLGASLPAPIRRAIAENLRAIHSEWANWHLKNRQYAKAREAAATAAAYHFSPGTLLKNSLLRLSPRLTARLLSMRERRGAVLGRTPCVQAPEPH